LGGGGSSLFKFRNGIPREGRGKMVWYGMVWDGRE